MLPSSSFSARRAFTLLEIIIVVTILALLAAILFPAFSRAREKARAAACGSNYKQVGLAIHLYAQDNDDLSPANGGSFAGLVSDCAPYIHSDAVFVCPDDYDRLEEGRAGSYRVPSLYQGKPMSCNWLNPYVGGQTTTTSLTTLCYEAEQDFAQAPIRPTYRHSEGTQILFFDGHAKWVPRQ